MNNLSRKAKFSQKKGIKRWGNEDIFTSSIRLLLFRHTANVSPAFAAKKQNTLSQKLAFCSKQFHFNTVRYLISEQGGFIYLLSKYSLQAGWKIVLKKLCEHACLIDTVKSQVLTRLIQNHMQAFSRLLMKGIFNGYVL